jgi:RNA polymerase sigma-70 factor (ECF subfamily)
LLRTKSKIARAGITLRVPAPERIADRIEAVLAVVYLVFNEGYLATEGEPLRDGLAADAIEIGTLLVDLLPQDDEVRALLALMLLQHSRRAARLDAHGELVPIDEQDRTLWDRDRIAAGIRTLTSVASDGVPGPYQLQAAIAVLHATAPSAAETDWERIVLAYDALLALQDSPVVALNRLIAVSYRDGPSAALADLPDLERRLDGYPAAAAARADFLRRAGRRTEAVAAYERAMGLANTDAERRFLRRRLLLTEQPAVRRG